jgi:hypothetical protein
MQLLNLRFLRYIQIGKCAILYLTELYGAVDASSIVRGFRKCSLSGEDLLNKDEDAAEVLLILA